MSANGKSNPSATEYWDGYRNASIEVLLTGIETVEAKYWAEDMANGTPYQRGFTDGLRKLKKELSERLKNANDSRAN